ncbi:MAG: 3'(2'),5'-bisphosphate nucleotidase CysQ [Pseudomonadota bacterium]
MPEPILSPPLTAEADRDLLVEAVERAGEIAMRFFRAEVANWEKPDNAGPVSDADMAVDRELHRVLCAARPDYGWLSEESDDDLARLHRDRVFIVDPIDGTRAFLKGETGFAVAAAVVERGEVIASAVHLPARGETYAAALGAGATLNGEQISTSERRELAGATALGASASYKDAHWAKPLPQLDRVFRHALEWRLCLVAAGAFDLMVTMRDAYEWDVAAGALIASEAGAVITDRDGQRLCFNTSGAKLPGVIVAPGPLHAALVALRLGDG